MKTPAGRRRSSGLLLDACSLMNQEKTNKLHGSEVKWRRGTDESQEKENVFSLTTVDLL